MALVWSGAALSGLMWGWLCIARTGNTPRPLFNLLAVIGAALLLGGTIYWKVEPQAAIFFLIATFLSLLVHLVWRQVLHQRFGPLRKELEP